MASRYGRNKRRQARETIENLSSALQHAARTRADLDRINHNQARRLHEMEERMKGWDRRIRFLLGPYTSAGIDDVTFVVRYPEQIVELPVIPRMASTALLGPGAMSDDSVTYHVERILHLIEGMEERHLDDLGRRMFFDIEIPGHYKPIAQARYGMSESYYNDLKRAGEQGIKVLAHHIARDVAIILLGHKKEKKP